MDQTNPPAVDIRGAGCYPHDVSHSLLSTTPTAEKPALNEQQRVKRLRSLAERLHRPDGLDRDALKRIEKLTGHEQQ